MTSSDPTTVAAARLEEMEQAWNRADGAAFGAVFADDAEFIDIRGAYHRGEDAISHGHQVLFDSIYAESTIQYQLETAREVAPGCLIAIANATLNAPTGPMQGVNRSRLTATITERSGRWSVVAFQNTLIRQGT